MDVASSHGDEVLESAPAVNRGNVRLKERSHTPHTPHHTTHTHTHMHTPHAHTA